MRFRTVIVLIICCLILLMPVSFADTEVSAYDPFEVYRGTAGSFPFALPGMPTAIVHEYEMINLWQDGIQMWGVCKSDGAEYQLRAADITQGIEYFTGLNPKDPREKNNWRALYAFSSYYIDYQGGTAGAPMINAEDQSMIFHYTYPDTPESTYTAKCLLDGSYAVCLLMEDCEHQERAFSELKKITEEEKEVLKNAQPYPTNFNGIPMTFPKEPIYLNVDNGSTAICFAEDYTRIIAQYVPIGLKLDMDQEEAADSLKMLAEKAMDIVGGGKVESGTASGDADHWEYEYTALLDSPYNTTFRDDFLWIGRVYTGESGIWYLMCNDTETGRTWLNSAGETSLDLPWSYLSIELNAHLAEERKDDGAPATLRQLIRGITEIQKDESFSGLFDDVQIGDALFSNGQWVRTAAIANDAFALLFMSSEKITAVINEIHIIVNDEYVAEVLGILSAGFAQAAEGEDYPELAAIRQGNSSRLPENWEGKRYRTKESHESKGGPFDYWLLTMKAVHPETVHHIPEWTEEIAFDVPEKSVNDFRTDWNRKDSNWYGGQFPLQTLDPQPADDGKFVHFFIFGDQTCIALTADSEKEIGLISKLQIYNLNDFSAQTFLGGLMALAIMTDMPEDEFIRMTLMLQEYPMWNDLLDLDPVVGWKGKMLVLTGDEYNGQYVPNAYILDMTIPIE